MRTERPTLPGIVFLIGLGLGFFGFGAWCLVRQKLPFSRKIITPDVHPVFFWCAVLFYLGVGGFVLYRAVVEFAIWRRSRRN